MYKFLLSIHVHKDGIAGPCHKILPNSFKVIYKLHYFQHDNFRYSVSSAVFIIVTLFNLSSVGECIDLFSYSFHLFYD